MCKKPRIPVQPDGRLAQSVAAFRWAVIEVLDATAQRRGWTFARWLPMPSADPLNYPH